MHRKTNNKTSHTTSTKLTPLPRPNGHALVAASLVQTSHLVLKNTHQFLTSSRIVTNVVFHSLKNLQNILNNFVGKHTFWRYIFAGRKKNSRTSYFEKSRRR